MIIPHTDMYTTVTAHVYIYTYVNTYIHTCVHVAIHVYIYTTWTKRRGPAGHSCIWSDRRCRGSILIPRAHVWKDPNIYMHACVHTYINKCQYTTRTERRGTAGCSRVWKDGRCWSSSILISYIWLCLRSAVECVGVCACMCVCARVCVCVRVSEREWERERERECVCVWLCVGHKQWQAMSGMLIQHTWLRVSFGKLR